MRTMTFEERYRNGLLKKYHTLVGRVGMDDDTRRMMLLRNYGVTSSRDLSIAQLVDVCVVLEEQLNPNIAEMDKLRKRLIAAVAGWMSAMCLVENDYNARMKKIKAIACRASRRDSFNDIPAEQLRSLYAAFTKKKKDLTAVDVATAEVIEGLIQLN